MLLPIDDPPDRLYGLIVHELTHQFEFDIIPQSLIRRSVPLWVNEGLSDYERGQWSPIDLMTVRDAAVADIVPKMTRDRRLRQHRATRGWSTTSVTRCSSSSKRSSARKASASSCSRCARA